jgi:hypothetical protein
MKYFFFFVFQMLWGIFSFAQYDTLKFPIPMQNGLVIYEREYPLTKNKSAAQILGNFAKRLSSVAPDYHPGIPNKNELKQAISGAILFRVDIPQTGNYFWLKASFRLLANENSMKIQVKDFFEKPIEKGVTNDYSKIEYRWWDFRHAKPWSNEDEALFMGLDQKTRNFLDLTGKEITE